MCERMHIPWQDNKVIFVNGSCDARLHGGDLRPGTHGGNHNGSSEKDRAQTHSVLELHDFPASKFQSERYNRPHVCSQISGRGDSFDESAGRLAQMEFTCERLICSVPGVGTVCKIWRCV